ncbi:citryl-CoA lyase [Mycobacterium sp. E796]|uniref:citryl-CoA lyase n=1 Tax=Mycobacterium sp. E796 TaxID=1834151 RepID=UPI0008025059|nr:citryl-CoA lyase [Mycobacterium sp. E796]OBI52007.1 citryl-CoA lyase [Mycobacterium sp. E796]
MNTARDHAETSTTTRDVTDWWSTAVSDIEPGVIRLRGYPIQEMIGSVGLTDMIWLMIRGDLPRPEHAELLELVLVAAVDHGPQAPSIAAARMAATCGVGLHGAMSTGIGMLGDIHGGAGQQCMQLLEEIASDPRELKVVVGEMLSRYREANSYVPGFGHRFHPRDPRRDPLMDAARKQVAAGTITGKYLAIAEEIELQLAAGRDRPVPMNIDGATAVICAELGFPAELGRGLFILSRSVGILAHAWEERRGGRRIKGPIPPPLLPTYTGPEQRSVPDRGHA